MLLDCWLSGMNGYIGLAGGPSYQCSGVAVDRLALV